MRQLLGILTGVVLVTQALAQTKKIHIWHNTRVNNEEVTLTAYEPERPNGMAVIICPGGSYFWLSLGTEGHDVAMRLKDEGYTAFVLNYRTGGVGAFVTHYRALGPGNHFPFMLQDLQRSLQLIRANANYYDIDKIGVMGFSAGGHLALMSAVFGEENYLSELGISTTVPLSPDFIAPIYPVVTMSGPYTHKRSRRGLVGERDENNAALCQQLSIEKNVDKIKCPVFIMNCVDDPIVDYRNSVLLDEALREKGIPHVYIQYKSGGHGFGASPEKTSAEAGEWIKSFFEWTKTTFKQ